MEVSRRWSGYVCPDCRFVFRVPMDHDGQGVVCPSCRRLLRIPSSSDVPPPLLSQERVAESDESLREPESKRKKKRRKEGKTLATKDQSWETMPSERRSKRRENLQMRWMFISGIALFVASLAGVIFALNQKTDPPPPEVKASTPEPAPKKEGLGERSDVSLLAEAQPLAHQFLHAKTVEELLPCVRNIEIVRPRIQTFYPQGKIQAAGMAKFNSTGVVARKESSIAISVRTNDQDEKQLAFVDTPEGLRIDWEAWVGWSEVRWDDFISNRPSTPSRFRVILGKVDYYNFGFLDDLKWRSYRLESPDGEHSLYGYIERGSALDRRIQLDADVTRLPIMVALKFPSNSTGKDQVEITEVYAEGWVEK